VDSPNVNRRGVAAAVVAVAVAAFPLFAVPVAAAIPGVVVGITPTVAHPPPSSDEEPPSKTPPKSRPGLPGRRQRPQVDDDPLGLVIGHFASGGRFASSIIDDRVSK